MLTVAQGRPPLVQFETRAEVDRAESERAGKVIYKDIDYALITPAGSKDVIEKIAVEWLQAKKKEVIDGRFDQKWLEYYERSYAEWKKGNEVPLNGTPIKMWPIVTPAEVRQLAEARIFTVEDLAECSESGLSMIGMGGRVLRDKAKAWVESAVRQGQVAEEVGNLKEELRRRDELIETLNKRLTELEAESKRKKAA